MALHFGAALLFTCLSSCYYEDHGYGFCVASVSATLEMRDRLSCAFSSRSGYPERLDSVLDTSLDDACGPRSEQLSEFVRLARRDGDELVFIQHRWAYTPADRLSPGLFRTYGISVSDERPEERYISFWVDHTGILRSARGRRAGPADQPYGRQRD